MSKPTTAEPVTPLRAATGVSVPVFGDVPPLLEKSMLPWDTRLLLVPSISYSVVAPLVPPPALLREYAVARMPEFGGFRSVSVVSAPVPPLGMRRLLPVAPLVTTRSALAVGLKSAVTRANPVGRVSALMLVSVPLDAIV